MAPTGHVARGFTLTELLVVVSIISLMMSALIPSLTRAMRKSEQVHCLANQHQVHLAWMLAIANNDDKLPASLLALKPYAPNDEVFFCKTAVQESENRDASSYSLSNTMGGLFRDGVAPYEQFHRIAHPGESMVFTDGDGYDTTCWPLLRDSERRQWLWRPPTLWGLNGIANRHNNGSNMTFADGHGEMIHWRDPRTRELINGTMADEVEASHQNGDLDYLVRVLVGDIPVQDDGKGQE